MAVKQDDFQQCTYCGKNKRVGKGKIVGEFYVSNSIVYSHLGRLPICKECLIDIFDQLVKEYASDKLALYKICRMTDTYYTNEAYDMVKKTLATSNQSLVQAYFWKINSLNQFKDRTFENTNIEEDVIKESVGLECEFEISVDIRRFWGMGFTDSEYAYLQNYYDDLLTAYECKTPMQRNIYKDLSINALKKSKCDNANDLKKHIDIQAALMNDANIKPIQDKGDEGLSTWGMWIKKIEDEEPIPEVEDKFKDIDGIGGYIKRFFVTHMERIFGLHPDDLDQEESDINNGAFKLKSGDK